MPELAASRPRDPLTAEQLAELRAQRRARREERRAKQRLLNVVRAKKMHVARLAYERAQSKSHDSVTTAPSSVVDPRSAVHVGCSGWFYWHWRECFYPQDSSTSKWFDHYASQFDTVELNAPFYGWPTVGTVETWLKQAARRRNFIYTVKVSELITHVKRYVGTRTLVRDFGYIADLLGPRRMGCFLFQSPPSFRYSMASLKRIVSQLDPSRRNVVELRHKSWWNENTYAALRDVGAIFCSCSGPRLPDELIRTSDEIYLRFHGTTRWYQHDYTPEELAVWAKRVADSGAKRVWIYFNNDRNGYAIKNAREMLRQLKAAGLSVPKRWPQLREDYVPPAPVITTSTAKTRRRAIAQT